MQATDCDAHVSELVELVLKPPHGGPPLFPDQSDEVICSFLCFKINIYSVLSCVHHIDVVVIPRSVQMRLALLKIMKYCFVFAQVLAALNLYRFALLNDGNGFLSKKTLERDYKGWLLPLRTIVSGSIAENQREKDHDQESSLEILCILNRIESLLYWCIELVEERLKSH